MFELGFTNTIIAGHRWVSKAIGRVQRQGFGLLSDRRGPLGNSAKPLRHLSRLILVLGLATACVSGSRVQAQQKGHEALGEPATEFLQNYCFDCHNKTDAAAGLDLEHFKTIGSLRFENDVWEKVGRRVADGSMPPAEMGEVPAAEKESFAQWVDDALHKIDCSDAIYPGQVTIRRLTKLEYQNSVRDLLGVDYRPAASFPGDDSGYGFDNIGDVLSLPPVLMEKYLDAAEAVTQQVIMTPEDYVPDQFDLPLSQWSKEGGVGDGDNLLFYSNGTASFDHNFSQGGKYQLVIYAKGDQAGDEPCKMTVSLDQRKLRQVQVKEDNKLDDTKLDIKVKAGKHKIQIRFDNDFYNESAPPGQRDRNLIVQRVMLIGPEGFGGSVSEFHKRFFFEFPKRPQDENQVAAKLLGVWSSRFFRRPTAEHEVKSIYEIYRTVRADGASFEKAMQIALQAILVSPKFLFKVERPANADGSVRLLTNYELATNLSYFLWSTTPDDVLLAAAAKQDLQSTAVLRAQVRRMLAADKSEQLVENFAVQWLQLRILQDFQPDPDRFKDVDAELLADMRKETELFCREILRSDRSILELLDADFTYVNGRLAKHYELRGVDEKNSEFQRVSLSGTARGGLLTQASILAVTSNPTRTSPVKRGKWIMENLLGEPPPPAAPDVMPLEQQQLNGTLRQRMEQHRVDPACASCHKLMDPLGFALENFDAVGRWRDRDDGGPIDASGTLPSGESFQGITELKKILTSQKKDKFVRCLTEKMLIYALGRGLRYEDQCAINEIVARLEQNDYRISELVIAIVESAPFRQRQANLQP